MSKTTKVVQDVELKAVPLPVKTDTYTVISHGFIIDEVKKGLAKAGFEILAEEYRANNNLEVARGSYVIKRSEDPNFLMSFNWTNSYDKSTKFQCAVGGFVWENNAYVIEKEDNTFIRKHTGDADTLVQETIADKIANAEKYYLSVLDAKHKMENIKVSRGQIAKILGDLYFNFDMISIEQLSGIKKEYTKPSYVYSTDSDSLWTVYCHILTVLKSAHPKLWIHQQGFVHNYIKINYLTLTDPVATTVPAPAMDILPKAPSISVDPAQIDLLNSIADLEADQIDEDLKYAAAEEHNYVTVEEYTEARNEVVTYTDPAGNTFETISFEPEGEIVEKEVLPEPVQEEFTEEEIEEVREAYENLHPAKDEADNSVIVNDESIINKLKSEVENIFGYSVEIEVYLENDNYAIVTSDGQEVTVPVDYVNSIL